MEKNIFLDIGIYAPVILKMIFFLFPLIYIFLPIVVWMLPSKKRKTGRNNEKLSRP
jgi:hypothetical protein